MFVPEGHDADKLRKVVLDQFNMSLGIGLCKLAGRVFRIGHLGSFNDLMLMGTLSGVEMGLRVAGIPHREGGVMAAMDYLAETPGGGTCTGGMRSRRQETRVGRLFAVTSQEEFAADRSLGDRQRFIGQRKGWE